MALNGRVFLVLVDLKKGRNVTTDNFFTSLKLAEKLRSESTSIVGTMRRARREVPANCRNIRTKRYETFILKSATNTTLTIYQGKPGKNVIVLSTLHENIHIDAESKKKLPETIQFYNETKVGVDIIDQMARKYTVRAGTRRWPVHVFYNILDLAAINSWIIYRQVTGENISRHNYILQLVSELRAEYVNKKQSASAFQRLDNITIEEEQPSTSQKRRQCQINSKCKKNRTCDLCTICQKAVCGQCVKKVFKKIICNKCFM